jgi:sulfur carrier protein
MTIELNGRRIVLGDAATLADAVGKAGVGSDARGVAVAIDGEVVPRAEWDRVELREGQSVEVVGAVQGG